MRQKTINIYQFKELPEDIQEKAIQNNYDEYLTSEEAIKEALIANEYEFDESGAIV